MENQPPKSDAVLTVHLKEEIIKRLQVFVQKARLVANHNLANEIQEMVDELKSL